MVLEIGLDYVISYNVRVFFYQDSQAELYGEVLMVSCFFSLVFVSFFHHLNIKLSSPTSYLDTFLKINESF